MKKRKWIDKHMLKAFKSARPRLLSVWPKLKEKGWTKKDLFQAGTLKHPHGDWGIAWSSVWLIPGMRAYIRDDGVMVFKWKENNGRVVKQTARPKAKAIRRKTK